MSELYHPAIRDASRAVPSHWQATAGPEPDCPPLTGERTVEVAIIGGGYTGLSAAWHLARRHGIEALVLEAGRIGWGASGRNGGFCCLGGDKLGLEGIASRFGADAARDWHAAQKGAIDLVRDLAQAEAIDHQPIGEGELIIAHRPGRLEELRRRAASVEQLLGERWPVLAADALRAEWLTAEEAHGAIYVPHGFGLHPLRQAQGMAVAAVRAGAAVHGQSRVIAWEQAGGEHLLHVAGGRVRARRVLVATNGFTAEALHPALAGRLLPALSAILVTRPLTEAELGAQGWHRPVMLADTRDLLFYIRLLPDNRLLFGARGGTDASPAAFARRRRWLERALGQRFPAWRDVAIDHAWWGLVCLALDRVPHLALLADLPGVHVALAYHGGGVAMAHWLGRAAAAEIAGRPQPGPLPAFVRRPLPRFPWPKARIGLLRAAYLVAGLRDRWL